MFNGFRAAALLMMLALAPALPAATLPCDSVCGQWQLEAGTAPSAEAAVDTALARYSGPRLPGRQRAPRTLEGAAREDMERAIGPIDDRLPHEALRAELLRLLQVPAQLQIRQRGADLLIESPGSGARRFSPGVSHARIDADGTATIRCVLKPRRLTITETYARNRRNGEDYSVDREGNRLTVIRELRRPGLAPVRFEVHYRRVTDLGLESPSS